MSHPLLNAITELESGELVSDLGSYRVIMTKTPHDLNDALKLRELMGRLNLTPADVERDAEMIRAVENTVEQRSAEKDPERRQWLTRWISRDMAKAPRIYGEAPQENIVLLQEGNPNAKPNRHVPFEIAADAVDPHGKYSRSGYTR